ncbi:hypothetical protein AMS68_002353 [Peltaster fructicola]|uniref:Thioredoxin domain-containing protein n=1 Tax=Peltaster fructicola TaxID=286661 RepID=A0A6H0XQ69_9PEZI|nr:hypothetical protein AMS68_002353 [Peltaster fructicola]
MDPLSKAVVGRPAPAFHGRAIVDGRIKEISLSSYTEANHWVVLIFFPRAFSFICPTEIRSFSARLEEFLYSRSCAIVFASTDSDLCLRAWNNTSELEGGLGGVHVPLISDPTHKLCRDYGVLIEEDGAAQRALFIIDPKGVLRCMSVNDADVGRSVDEVQRTLDALAFKDEYGEGCPVDWKRGDQGIDIASKSKVEGQIEIEPRKSWTEWARPKLSRGWSNASAVSAVSSGRVIGRIPSGDATVLPTLAKPGTQNEIPRQPQRPQSMFLTTTSNTNPDGQMLQVMNMTKAEQNLNNERAAAMNREVRTAL